VSVLNSAQAESPSPLESVADSILHGGDLVDLFKDYARTYPTAGYGGDFRRWAASDSRESYNSWGNGAAMRVSAVGYAYNSLDEVLMRAKWTAELTHDHREGIKGARATAAAIYLARTGNGKDEIRAYIEREFGYSLDASIDDLRPSFTFHVSCQATVPPAISVLAGWRVASLLRHVDHDPHRCPDRTNPI
jgi:ADP-ribosylglycohydrolase